MVVPEITDRSTLLVNIHEYVHALRFYKNLGQKLIWNPDKAENEAMSAEQEYIKKSER